MKTSVIAPLEEENVRLKAEIALLHADATARHHGKNLDESVRRETVEDAGRGGEVGSVGDLSDCGACFGGGTVVDSLGQDTGETCPDCNGSGAALAKPPHTVPQPAEPSPSAGAGWFATGLPDLGRRFIALYDDGSGGFAAYRHDGGYFDQDGDDFTVLRSVGFWAYAPAGFQLHCELAGDDPFQIPSDVVSGTPVSVEPGRRSSEEEIARLIRTHLSLSYTPWDVARRPDIVGTDDAARAVLALFDAPASPAPAGVVVSEAMVEAGVRAAQQVVTTGVDDRAAEIAHDYAVARATIEAALAVDTPSQPDKDGDGSERREVGR